MQRDPNSPYFYDTAATNESKAVLRSPTKPLQFWCRFRAKGINHGDTEYTEIVQMTNDNLNDQTQPSVYLVIGTWSFLLRALCVSVVNYFSCFDSEEYPWMS
jgi:hypothetical protein